MKCLHCDSEAIVKVRRRFFEGWIWAELCKFHDALQPKKLKRISMTKTLGQVGYESYCLSTNWKSNNLPQWEDVQDNVKAAWEVAASSVVEYHCQHIENISAALIRVVEEDYNISDIIKCPIMTDGVARIVGTDPCPNPNFNPWDFLIQDTKTGKIERVRLSEVEEWNA